MAKVEFGEGVGGIEPRAAKNIREAASALIRGFDWGASAEGFEFWAAICDRLIDMTNELESTGSGALDDACDALGACAAALGVEIESITIRAAE